MSDELQAQILELLEEICVQHKQMKEEFAKSDFESRIKELDVQTLRLMQMAETQRIAIEHLEKRLEVL